MAITFDNGYGPPDGTHSDYQGLGDACDCRTPRALQGLPATSVSTAALEGGLLYFVVKSNLPVWVKILLGLRAAARVHDAYPTQQIVTQQSVKDEET